jgi:hypothetical protein
MTFDNVPWVITMKKNEHYFPTVEWKKDDSEECGWKRTAYENNGKPHDGEPNEGIITGAEDTGDLDEILV